MFLIAILFLLLNVCHSYNVGLPMLAESFLEEGMLPTEDWFKSIEAIEKVDYFSDLHADIFATMKKQVEKHERKMSELATADDFICISLPSGYSPFLTCSGIVDYPFYFNSGTSFEEMEASVRTLAAPFNSFINSACLTDVKRLICAQVFKPCVSDGK